jgi:hypothetical protein
VLLKQAIDNDATHALFIDTDMTFPYDAAIRLASHGKTVIACNYVVRQISKIPGRPYFPCASFEDCQPLFTFPESTGVVEVFQTGTGMMMLDLSIVKNLSLPWFEITFDSRRETHLPEDLYFCKRLREAGHKIYIDQDLSKEIGHVNAAFELRHEHTRPPL